MERQLSAVHHLRKNLLNLTLLIVTVTETFKPSRLPGDRRPELNKPTTTRSSRGFFAEAALVGKLVLSFSGAAPPRQTRLPIAQPSSILFSKESENGENQGNSQVVFQSEGIWLHYANQRQCADERGHLCPSIQHCYRGRISYSGKSAPKLGILLVGTLLKFL